MRRLFDSTTTTSPVCSPLAAVAVGLVATMVSVCAVAHPGEHNSDALLADHGDIQADPRELPDVERELDDEHHGRFEGRRISQFQLECDLQLCEQPDDVERFKRISGLAEGQMYRQRDIERAQHRLAQTGFFRQLTIERQLGDDGVQVTIEASGAVVIRRIEFEGLSYPLLEPNPPPFESELRNVLMYRSGQVFIEDEEQIEAQLSSLESMFEQQGYFGTRITMQPRPVDDQPQLVDLVFEVHIGQQRRICEMGFRGVRAMSSAEARLLILSANSVWARRPPLRLPRFTTEQFREGREALVDEYRRRGYFRARIIDQDVRVDDDTDCVQLIVDVSEGPFWEVQFEGNEGLEPQQLREQLPFAESGYVDDNEIREAEHAVRQLYETHGYPFTRVQGRQEGDGQQRRLIFQVQEGPRVQIESIQFEGMHQFDEQQILEEFGTSAFGLLDAGGFLQTGQLLSDVERLEQRYREAGFLRAVVEGFRIEMTPAGDAITIEIEIDEGPQTLVDDVRLSGHEQLEEHQLRELLDIQDGSPFVPLQLQADRSRLAQHYGSAGFPEASVETSCYDQQGQPVECDAPDLPDRCLHTTFEQLAERGCQWDEQPRLTVDCHRRVPDDTCRFEGGVVDERASVHHRVREGSKVRVGEILLKGNFNTNSGVIFRELPLETGDVMDVDKLLEGQGNIRSLGLFESVNIETIGLEQSPRQLGGGPAEADGESSQQDNRTVPLVVSVEEARSRFMDVRFGVEGRELVDESRRLLGTGELQYTDDNFFGTGRRFRPRLIGAADTLQLARLASDTTDELDAATEVTQLDYLVGAELIYRNPRFLRRWTDELFLTVTPFYLLDLLGVATDQVLREELGLRLELRKELVELMERLFVTFGVEAKHAATWSPGDPQVGGERIFSPRRATGKLMPELTLDRRDSPLNPSEGYHLRLQPDLVTGDALAQGSEEVIGDSYWRLSFAASHFISPLPGLTFGQGIEFGQIVPLFERDQLVPPDERYYLGGVGSVRGFPANSLGPMGVRQQPTGGELMLNYSAELRYPLLDDLGVYGAAFFDTGLLVDCFDPDDQRSGAQCYRNAFPAGEPTAELRASAGLGLRYLLADQIPVLLDYGMVLDRRPAEGFGSLHFNLGYTF